jgi:small subunit ribosomal protein S5
MSQYHQKEPEKKNVVHVCSLRRVTRVTKGGKAMRFSALVVTGDEKGSVGYGLGRSVEVSEAVKKATRAAERRMIKIPLKKKHTIFHDMYEEYCGAKVCMKSAKVGRGVIAGGCMRYIFEALGVKDVVCKSIGSSNPHNIIKAVFNALKNMRTPRSVALLRAPIEVAKPQ